MRFETGQREAVRRRGMALTEVLLVVAIVMFLLIVVYNLLHRSYELADSASKAIELQQGARNLLENLVRDVNASHIFAAAEKDLLVMMKYRFEDPATPGGVLDNNAEPTFPFYENGRRTEMKLPVIATSYKWEPENQTIKRRVRRGLLIHRTPTAGLGENVLKYAEYQFTNAVEIEKARVLATSVKDLQFFYYGYDDDADKKLKPIAEVTGRNDRKVARIAMVLVRFKALFDEGLYGAGKLHKPEVEIATKIWSYKKLYDHVYMEYFSSMDDDTRF